MQVQRKLAGIFLGLSGIEQEAVGAVRNKVNKSTRLHTTRIFSMPNNYSKSESLVGLK